MKLYRAEGPGTGTGHFYSTRKEFAREFTRTGRDSEIATFDIDSSQVLNLGRKTPFAGDEAEMDTAIRQAKASGYSALFVSEGRNQPRSVFVIDKKALKRNPMINCKLQRMKNGRYRVLVNPLDWRKESWADLQRQGFMKPGRPIIKTFYEVWTDKGLSGTYDNMAAAKSIHAFEKEMGRHPKIKKIRKQTGERFG